MFGAAGAGGLPGAAGLPGLGGLTEFPAGFSAPWFLLLLLALPVVYLLGRRARRAHKTRAWPLSLWLRLGAVALLVLALAGLRLPGPPRSVATVFVLDLSDSVPEDVRAGAREWVRQALGQAGPDDLSGIVTFGADARVELPLGRARDHPRWGAPPLGHGTDVGGPCAWRGASCPRRTAGPCAGSCSSRTATRRPRTPAGP